jgi:hypothetical protein
MGYNRQTKQTAVLIVVRPRQREHMRTAETCVPHVSHTTIAADGRNATIPIHPREVVLGMELDLDWSGHNILTA